MEQANTIIEVKQNNIDAIESSEQKINQNKVEQDINCEIGKPQEYILGNIQPQQSELIMRKQVDKAEEVQKQQFGILPNLPKDINEVYSHYQLRKIVFQNVLADLNDEKKAVTYSYLWSNSFFLGVKYSENLMEIIKKYQPSKQLLESS